MKKIFITGASRGIGRALAIVFADKGYQLFLCARSTSELEQLRLDYEGKNDNIYYCECDVSDLQEVNKTLDLAIAELGNIDLAILNAGVGGSPSFKQFDLIELRQIFDINVFGVMNFMEGLIAHMRKFGGGTIAGVSSMADARSFPGASGYCASKVSLTYLLDTARIELAPENIKVVTIRPGYVETDMTSKNDYFMPFMQNAYDYALKVAAKLEKGSERIKIPWQTNIITSFLHIIPDFIFELILKIADISVKKKDE
jgi:short-subunit dehydrogenase